MHKKETKEREKHSSHHGKATKHVHVYLEVHKGHRCKKDKEKD